MTENLEKPSHTDPQTSGAKTQLHLEDHTANIRREVKIASDVAVKHLVPALVSALELPLTDPSGRAVVYHLAFGERQLQEEETLNSADVLEGANLTLVPELVAG